MNIQPSKLNEWCDKHSHTITVAKTVIETVGKIKNIKILHAITDACEIIQTNNTLNDLHNKNIDPVTACIATGTELIVSTAVSTAGFGIAASGAITSSMSTVLYGSALIASSNDIGHLSKNIVIKTSEHIKNIISTVSPLIHDLIKKPITNSVKHLNVDPTILTNDVTTRLVNNYYNIKTDDPIVIKFNCDEQLMDIGGSIMFLK